MLASRTRKCHLAVIALVMPMLLAFTGIPPKSGRDLQPDIEDIRAVAEAATPELRQVKLPILRRALLLRDQIYRSPMLAEGSPPATTTMEILQIGQSYRMAVAERSRSNLCNGKAILLMAALRAYGITSRMSAHYRDVVDAPDPAFTHASVDAYINGSWIALDPHFNISFIDKKGRLLGWEEVVHHIRNGIPIKRVTHGLTQIAGQTVDDYERTYGSPFNAVMRYVVLTASAVSPMTSLNPEWDGILRYADGKTFDGYASARWPFFQELVTPKPAALPQPAEPVPAEPVPAEPLPAGAKRPAEKPNI